MAVNPDPLLRGTFAGPGPGVWPEPPRFQAVVIGSQAIQLPVVPTAEDTTVPLLLGSDLPLSFVTGAGCELADRLASLDPDVVVTAATGGVPVGMAVARALGHDQLVVLQKTPRFHLADAFSEPVRGGAGPDQELWLDRARTWLIDRRRVAFVDDVISSGTSAASALRLLERAGGRVVAVGVLATEGERWRGVLGTGASLVNALGELPSFHRDGDGYWYVDGDVTGGAGER